MKNILLISGHTNLAASVANKTIIETVQKLLPEVEVVKLDELYPDYKINVPVEQQRLVKADIIVLEFPIFWYSAPSILERWMEETFQHGFSHGRTGDKLKGKKDKSKPIVISTRISNGYTSTRSTSPAQFVAAGTLNPQKARILLQLALTKTDNIDEIKRIFEAY